MIRLPLSLIAFTLAFCGNAAIAATYLPFTAGFEAGNFSEWNGGLDQSLEVSNADAFSGSHAARSTMTQGNTTDNYKDFYFGDHTSVNGVAADSGLWLKLHSKFETGFDYGSQQLHKIALINFTDDTGQRRYQIILNVWTATQRYFIENLKWNADGSFGGSLNGFNQNLPDPVSVNFGQWDKLKLYILPNTPGANDGIVRLWVNDVLELEYTGISMRESTSFNPNKLILSNYVPVSDVSGVQWWDNFYLGETDPDASDNVAPSPPTNLRVVPPQQ